uniref:Ig-like domain-containing protein n=1 Tax=Seriola dumerili TaxID=41447 RepID=A0A3B4V4P4_SERDU
MHHRESWRPMLCWISVSVSQSQTVDVQSGEDVTLQCSNISRSPTQMEWFRLVNRTKASCISSMYKAENEASFCDGFQNRFEMSSNISNVFLKIKRVDLSDSGLYFCGFYKDTHTVITDTIHLYVQGKIVFKSNLFQILFSHHIYSTLCLKFIYNTKTN